MSKHNWFYLVLMTFKVDSSIFSTPKLSIISQDIYQYFLLNSHIFTWSKAWAALCLPSLLFLQTTWNILKYMWECVRLKTFTCHTRKAPACSSWYDNFIVMPHCLIYHTTDTFIWYITQSYYSGNVYVLN